jgi:hypothetical protein
MATATVSQPKKKKPPRAKAPAVATQPKKKPPRAKAPPTRVYRFGCKLTGDRSTVYDQMRAAHQYRNQLVELERWRREQAASIVASVSPELAGMESELQELKETIVEKTDQLAKLRQQARRRVDDPELTKSLREAKAALRDLAARLKPVKKAAYESQAYKTASAEMEEENKTRQKALRKASPAFWGTYLIVENSMKDARKGAPPRFKSWRGDGRIAIQVQGHQPTMQEAMLGKCNLLRITKAPDGKHWDVGLRLSSRGGEVWATCRAKLHRMPPDDAKITWVTLVCRRVATHDRWSVQFTLSRKTGWPGRRGSGAVAVNLGWRLKQDGQIRAAFWRDGDGKTGELLLPPSCTGRLKEHDSLQSIRDKNFDTVKLKLSTWISGATDLPDWLVEATATLKQWRSQARLAALVVKWRNERFAGDEDAFVEAEEWRKQDKHLYEWQANTRRKYIAWRRNAYRNLAAQLSAEYETVVLANVKWKQLQDKPPAEEPDELRVARERKGITAPYELQTTLLQAFHAKALIDPKNLTATHVACQQLSETPNPLALTHSCEGCGETYDQDDNHCQNLLANWAENFGKSA